MINPKLFPSAMVLAATFVWSTSGLFVRWLGFPPATLSLFRSIIPVILVSIWYVVRGYRPSLDSLGLKLTASAINPVRMLAYFYGFTHTTIANAVIALYTWPIFAALFAWVLLGERVSGRQALLLALGFSGIPLLYIGSNLTISNADVLGISSMLVAAALHALTMVMLKKAKRGVDRFESIFYQNLISAFVFIPVLWIPGYQFTPGEAGLGIFYGAFVGVLGYALFFGGLHQMAAARASIITYFEVVGAVILAWFVFGETPGWNTILGGALVTVAVILAGSADRAPPD